jgi:hypothetical protein
MSATDLFRGQALKRVSSPEQLDRVVRTTLPLQCPALITLLAVVAAAVAWSAIATVLTTVPTVGLYIPLGGLDPASMPVAGIVTSLPAFTVGTRVSAGQVLATVAAAKVKPLPDELARVGAFGRMARVTGIPMRSRPVMSAMGVIPAVENSGRIRSRWLVSFAGVNARDLDEDKGELHVRSSRSGATDDPG